MADRIGRALRVALQAVAHRTCGQWTVFDGKPTLDANGICQVPSGGMSMSASVISRAWAWRSFVWAGVVGSVVAWAWAWFQVGGGYAVMLFVAVATVVLANRGVAGIRVALAGLMVAGFAMFLASLYLVYTLLLQGSQNVTAVDVLATSVFPMFASIVLLLGAASGFRRTTPA